MTFGSVKNCRLMVMGLCGLVAFTGCRAKAQTSVASAPTLQDSTSAGADAESAVAQRDAASDGAVDATPGAARLTLTADTNVMDAAFRRNFAADLVAQVRREDWRAFVPRAGTEVFEGACISLADGSVTPNTASRVCFEANLEGSDFANRLMEIADALTGVNRDPYGWKCGGDACTLQAGEMGFNGGITFAREGANVRMTHVGKGCGGALSEDSQKAIAREKPARPAKACPKVDPSCAGEIGMTAAKVLRDQCMQFWQAFSDDPDGGLACPVSNTCSQIRRDIQRGCKALGASRPAFCGAI